LSHEHKPVQLLLFEQETVSVEQVSAHFHTSEQTVRRLLDDGQLNGYRLTPRGWWNIYRASVEAFEAQLQGKYGAVGGRKRRLDLVLKQGKKGTKKP
jgi:hypothetical protein